MPAEGWGESGALHSARLVADEGVAGDVGGALVAPSSHAGLTLAERAGLRPLPPRPDRNKLADDGALESRPSAESRFPGNDGEDADATSAYTQVILSDMAEYHDLETWVSLPKHRQPKSWSK